MEGTRRHNEQEIDGLRQYGKLDESVERTLREAVVTKRVCDFTVCGDFMRRHVQLWQVKSPAQISAECERVEAFWPEPHDWPSDDWENATTPFRLAMQKRTWLETPCGLSSE